MKTEEKRLTFTELKRYDMKETQIPTDEQVNKLMSTVLKERNITLNPVQQVKFRHACIKSHTENPNADFTDLKTAAKIYLKFILDFPDMTL